MAGGHHCVHTCLGLGLGLANSHPDPDPNPNHCAHTQSFSSMKGASVAPGACMVSGAERSGLGGGALEQRPSGVAGPPVAPWALPACPEGGGLAGPLPEGHLALPMLRRVVEVEDDHRHVEVRQAVGGEEVGVGL